MKKFLLSLAAVAFVASAMMAQTPATTNNDPEEPDRVLLKKTMSKDPTGMDVPTGYDRPQVVAQKHECKDHKDGQKCDKPADQQCPDCKEKAVAAAKHECKDGMKECKKAEGMKECKKAEGMKHECKDGAAKQCDKAAMQKMHHECKDGAAKQCDKAAAEKKDCCKDKNMEGKKCDKPADQQCPDCKDKAKKN